MNHSFTPSSLDATKCRCNRSEIDHGPQATCDSCGNTCGIDGQIHGQRNLLLCQDCFAKEVEAWKKDSEKLNGLQTPASEILTVSKKIDQSIQVREDIFNAETVSIVELKRVIDADDSIINKHVTLASAIEARHNHFTQLLVTIRDQQQDALNRQRALQTFYQDLAKKLTIEERERIKLKDLNYKPEPPKLVKSKPAPVRKFDLAELKRVSAESKIPLQLLQGVCVRRNVTPQEAVKIMIESGF